MPLAMLPTCCDIAGRPGAQPVLIEKLALMGCTVAVSSSNHMREANQGIGPSRWKKGSSKTDAMASWPGMLGNGVTGPAGALVIDTRGWLPGKVRTSYEEGVTVLFESFFG